MEMIIIAIFLCTIWLAISLCIYFLPVGIAYIRNHKNTALIAVLTLVLGWTFFGWLAGLLWSLNSDVKKPEGSECS